MLISLLLAAFCACLLPVSGNFRYAVLFLFNLSMPVTMVALFLPTIMSVDKLAGLPSGKIAPAALVVFALMFLTPFHLKKAQTVGKIVMMVLGVAALVIVFLAGSDL